MIEAGAHFYICGNAKAFIADLKKTQRYQSDVY
jgi:sulfite reductase alpha subunit-like flavoprotein